MSEAKGNEVSAVALHGVWSPIAGGSDLRQELPIDPVLEQVLVILAALSNDVLLVSGAGERVNAGVRIVADAHTEFWPVGALYTALQAAQYERALAVATNTPLLNLPLLRYMILLSADYDAVLPRIAGNVATLPGVYGRACLRPLGHALAFGTSSMAAVLPELRVRYIEESEVDTFDPKHLSLLCVQSAQDWAWAQTFLKRRKR